MNCVRVTELRARYLCGQLDRDDTRDLEDHVLICRACADMLSEEREIDQCVRRAMLREQPDTAAIESRVRGAIRKQALRGRLLAVAAAAAVFVLLFVLNQPFDSATRGTLLCADAARDHFNEIVRLDPRHWRFTASEMHLLAVKQGLKPSLLDALASRGYQLERAKLCRLDGRVFLHAVYSNSQNRVSVYLRASASGRPPGQLKYALNGHPVFETEKRGEYIASIDVAGLTIIVVSSSSEQTALSFARSAVIVI